MLVCMLRPLSNLDMVRTLANAARLQLQHGADPAHHPRAEDGRALVDGTAAGYKAVLLAAAGRAAILPDAHDRGRHDRARAR